METNCFYIPDLLVFLVGFLLVYIFGYVGVFRGWGSKQQQEASSCLISLAHGTPAVLMAIHAILSTEQPRSFASANSTRQNFVLEFSIAYFMVDLLHYLVFFPNDFLFIGHHLGTLYVLITCRYVVKHGAMAILGILVLAEVTSACQNIWSLASARKKDDPTASKLHRFMSPPFYAFYSTVRGILAPLFLYEIGVFYSSGVADNVIPRLVWISWMIVVVAGILGSMLWILNLWMELFRPRSHLEQKIVS